VVDPQHSHGSSHFIDLIQDSICSAPCTKDASEFSSQLSADTVRVFNKGTSDELEYGRSNVFWKNVADCARCRSSYDKVINLVIHVTEEGRNERTASTPRTTSPAETAARASTNSRIAV
jgi:hypothetical protein